MPNDELDDKELTKDDAVGNDPDGTNAPPMDNLEGNTPCHPELAERDMKGAAPLSEVDELKKKCEQYLDGWRRAQADYQNLVKETGRQRLETVRFANEDMILDLLPIMDNFKMAYNQIPDNEKDSSWVIGFSHIKKQLWDVLAVAGVKEILTVGQKFDPSQHEAIDKRTEADKEDDIILNEVKAGYTLNGKVIQVAKVIINHLEK